MLVAFGPALAIVSVVAYGIIRYSYQQFYEKLGVGPEEVGATSTAVLAQSGAGVIEYSFYFAVVPIALTLASFFFLAANIRLRRAAGGALLALIAVVPMVVYEWLYIGNGPTQFSVVGGNVGLTLLGLMIVAWRSRDHEIRTAFGWRHVAVVWLSTGVIWVNLFYLPGAASKAGKCAATGRPVHFVITRRSAPFVGHIRVLGLQAGRAAVAWIGHAPSGLHFSPMLLYLGQTTGTAVVYDYTSEKAIRFPASDAAISTSRPGKNVC